MPRSTAPDKCPWVRSAEEHRVLKAKAAGDNRHGAGWGPEPPPESEEKVAARVAARVAAAAVAEKKAAVSAIELWPSKST